MTKKQKDKIKELKQYIKGKENLRNDLFRKADDWRKLFIKLSKKKKTHKKKICNYCGNPIDRKPESKEEKRQRVEDGINKLKEKGILQ